MEKLVMEKEELCELRKKQIDGPYGEAERKRFLELLELTEKEETFTPEQKERYLQLSKEQTDSVNWTPEKAQELQILLSVKNHKSCR